MTAHAEAQAPMTAPTLPTAHLCPLCSTPWRSGTERCWRCGADLTDPDVQALIEQQRAAGGASAADEASAGPAGSLGSGKIAGVTLEGLVDGWGLRKVAGIGAGLMLVAFVLPAMRNFHYLPPLAYGDDPVRVVTHQFSWDLWKTGNELGLVFPLFAAFVAAVVAFAPRLSGAWRGGILAALGLLGFAFCLGPQGSYGLAPTRMFTVANLGILIAGVAMAARMLMPSSEPARWGLVAGGVIFLAGMLIPVGELAKVLPGDYSLFSEKLELDLTDSIPLVELTKGSGSVASLTLVTGWLLIPLILIPAAALLAWKRPEGIWDKDGLALRPVAWVVIEYFPILYGIMAFSVFGWQDDLAESALVGRVRLAIMAAPLAMWAQLGLLSVILNGAKRREQAAAKPA